MKSRPEIPAGPYLVVGLARSGIAAALALRAREEQVVGVDRGVPGGLDALTEAGVELHLQSDGLSLLERVNTVVKSPGVPAQAPVIVQARARDMCVLGELELAWRMLDNEFVAVTGTNGKTTTVELIGHIYREAGMPVVVAGNVGVALSGLVGRLDEHVTVVCEASSFQLEDTLRFAPEAAVLLNLTPDHLDRHGTLDEYTQAKLRIFANQLAGDVAVVPAGFEPERLLGIAERVEFGDAPGAQLSLHEDLLCWRREPLLRAGELRLRGSHNLENAMAAAAVCLVRGIDPERVRAALRSFNGVAHRLEQLSSEHEALFINDSKATNVTSTLVALRAMADAHLAVHLILGGQGKGQDFAPLLPVVRETCRAVYLIGEDAPMITLALQDAGIPVHECGTLEQALSAAAKAAVRDEAVLLSPGCASFDQFTDFEARGERFRELVAQL